MGAGPDDPATTPLRSEVEALVEEAASRLRTENRPKLADGVIEQLHAPRPSTPSVIVAGEDKRGKSSLVNALLARPGLSPIGVEVVTGSPISFVLSAPPRASILHYGANEPVTADFEDARRLATIQGNPQNEANIRSIELGIDHPLLAELVIVDTPGVGGLNSGHAELTLQSLAAADALIFVLDAVAQIRAGELEFLRRASSRIDTVILVLTKTDLHRGWRTIMEDDRRILSEQAPRFANSPFLPVSSSLALRAVGLDDPEEEAAVRDESGFTALEAALRQRVIERSAILSDTNRLRAAMGPLVVTGRSIADRLAVTANSRAGTDQLHRERARLKELASEKAEWPRKLDSEVRRITLMRSENLAFGLSEIRRRYDDRLKEPSKQDMESLPGELVADLTALAARLNEDAGERLTALMRQLLAEVEPPEQIDEAVQQLTSDRLTDQLNSVAMGDRRMTHSDRLSVLSSFSSGRSLSTLFTGGALSVTTGLAIIPGVGIAIGIGLGALYAFSVFKGRRQSLFSNEFRNWMTEQCAATQTTVNMTFQRELIDVQDQMRQLVRTTLAARETEIQEALKAAQTLQAAAAEERNAVRADLTARNQSIRDLQIRINRALTGLQEVADLQEVAGSNEVDGP